MLRPELVLLTLVVILRQEIMLLRKYYPTIPPLIRLRYLENLEVGHTKIYIHLLI